jgi:GT2 family glycosyltransferase
LKRPIHIKTEVIRMAATKPARARRSKRPASAPAERGVLLQEAYSEGYRQGVQNGLQSFGKLFEGTSIVIPSYNQLQLLRNCINSIIEHTEVPYEIIVVDNASTDGTSAYLRKLGGLVRFRTMDTNRGFAGAINMGMMMAKGRKILLLNNDTLATAYWLSNMLACLNSDPAIGMVGPVTNFISGDQQIPVPYSDVREMQAFARRHNRRDSSKWTLTDRLVGYCLLFHREVFESVGYFDEGFEVGNFEDDDFNVRVRMLGYRLMTARDTFIHHIGSVSMRATLGSLFMEVNDRNEHFYMDKWNQPQHWIDRARGCANGGAVTGVSLYPENIAVQAIGPNIYWIDGGHRRLVEGALAIPVSRVSQIDLRAWPNGNPIPADEVEHRWRGHADGSYTDAGVVMLPDGNTYHVEGKTLRPIVSARAMQMWNLHVKPFRMEGPDWLGGHVVGLPIIAPPELHQLL